MSIYTEIILDHYQNPRNFGRIPNPSFHSQASNPLCGDRLELDIVVEEQKIKDIKFQGVGCAISIASASLVTETLKNKDLLYLKKIDKNFIIKLLNIDLGVNRLKCALLILEAIKKLLV
ncbi:MAG: iron-sulfur cluster assembly scaffold protein [Patescibacteria group bacterium]|nr:iron-sulfur cluster assembly scaffold protein [Patescibacteria group bacterium]